MTRLQLETWALRIIEAVRNHRPHEDSSVELKATWPEPQKVARQIAGHANAARGEPILWLIGVDERTGVVGADPMNLANWMSTVRGQFDGAVPDLTDLNLEVDGTTPVALLFGTEGAPYVVKNYAGGHVQFEVPWRDGTSTRSATRADLLRLLSPHLRLPVVEVLGGSASVETGNFPPEHTHAAWRWHVHLELYVVPRSVERVVIPFHRCSGSFRIGQEKLPLAVHLEVTEFSNYIHENAKARRSSATIAGTRTELLVDGPGAVTLSGRIDSPVLESLAPDAEMEVIAHLHPINADRALELSTVLKPRPTTGLGNGSPGGKRQTLARWAGRHSQ